MVLLLCRNILFTSIYFSINFTTLAYYHPKHLTAVTLKHNIPLLARNRRRVAVTDRHTHTTHSPIPLHFAVGHARALCDCVYPVWRQKQRDDDVSAHRIFSSTTKHFIINTRICRGGLVVLRASRQLWTNARIYTTYMLCTPRARVFGWS